MSNPLVMSAAFAAAEPLTAALQRESTAVPLADEPQQSTTAVPAVPATPVASVTTTITTTTMTTTPPPLPPAAGAAANATGADPVAVGTPLLPVLPTAAGPGVTISATPSENSFAQFYKTPQTAKPHRDRVAPSQQIARLACILPLSAIGLAAMTFPLHGSFPRLAMLIDALNGGLLFIGMVCASVALSAARRAGRKGVMLPAAAGTFFSGTFVGLIVGWLTLAPRSAPAPAVAAASPTTETTVTAPQPPAPAARPVKANHPRPTPKLDLNDPSKTGRDAMARYAGWYGTATAKGATISIGEFAAAAPVVDELRSMFDSRPNVLLIGIDNSHGRAPLSIDPSSLRAESADGRRILALPVQTVLETAQVERDRLMSLFNRIVEASPGQAATYGFAFLPAETDLKAIDHVSLILNGRRVVLSGQYLSAAQKAELARRAEAQAMR